MLTERHNMVFNITYLTSSEVHIRIDIPVNMNIDEVIEETKTEITFLKNFQVTLGRDVHFECYRPKEEDYDKAIAIMLLIGDELGNQCHTLSMFTNSHIGEVEVIQNKI